MHISVERHKNIRIENADAAIFALQRISSQLRSLVMARKVLLNMEVILDVVCCFIHVHDIALLGIGILQQLPFKKNDLVSLGEAGGCDIFFLVVIRHPFDIALCATCLQLCIMLSCDILSNQILLGSVPNARALANLMTECNFDANIATKGSALIANLCRSSPEIQSIMGNTGICDAVVQCLNCHMHDEQVAAACCRAIIGLSSNHCELNLEQLRPVRFLMMYISSVQRYRSHNLHVWKYVYSILISLFCNGDTDIVISSFQRELASDLMIILQMGLMGDSFDDTYVSLASSVLILISQLGPALPSMKMELISAGALDALTDYSEAEEKWTDTVRALADVAHKTICQFEAAEADEDFLSALARLRDGIAWKDDATTLQALENLYGLTVMDAPEGREIGTTVVIRDCQGDLICALESFSENTEIQRIVLKLLQNEWLFTLDVENLANSASILLKTLTVFKNDAKTRSLCLSILGRNINLTDSSGFASSRSLGIIVVRTIEHFIDEPKVIVNGCLLITYLCKSSLRNRPLNGLTNESYGLE